MTKTYYIIKASTMTLEATYLILHMKEHYNSVDEAMKVLLGADTDIIPPESTIYEIREKIDMCRDVCLSADITMNALVAQKE